MYIKRNNSTLATYYEKLKFFIILIIGQKKPSYKIKKYVRYNHIRII